MRKYKHIKTGRYAEQTFEDSKLYYVEKLTGTLPSVFIEESNDWEEIIEKDAKHIKKPLFTTEDGIPAEDGVTNVCYLKLVDNVWELFYRGGIYYQNSVNSGIWKAFSNVKAAQHWLKIKYPDKLFTTNDNVDIYRGDEYYSINDFWEITEHDTRIIINCNPTFSTKEAAKEYILMNKPCLSLNDVFSTVTWLENSNRKLLKELVIKKLRDGEI
jgi:hypothetical protein